MTAHGIAVIHSGSLPLEAESPEPEQLGLLKATTLMQFVDQ